MSEITQAHSNRDALLELADLEVTGTTFPGGAPDAEVHALMDELSGMQTWVTLLMCQQVPKAREAMDLIQRTRVLIVERLYPAALKSPSSTDGDGVA